MGHFARHLSAQEIKQGYALLNLMEHLDREMDLLNQQRIRVGPSTKEGQRLTQIKQSHLRKELFLCDYNVPQVLHQQNCQLPHILSDVTL